MVWRSANGSSSRCVTWLATKLTKYGTSWCRPGSDRTDSSAASRSRPTSSSGLSSRMAAWILSKYSASSLLMMCLTAGLNDTLSLPASAASAALAPGPLGSSSWLRDSAVVGFCGIDGCTPSMASQCAVAGVPCQRISRLYALFSRMSGINLPVKLASRGTLGRGALMSFSKSTSSSSM